MMGPIGCLLFTVNCFALVSSVLAGYEANDRYAPLNKTVSWSPCPNQEGFDCGTFDVPLDYANLTLGKARIALIRLNATERRRGSIFVNPGGPGESGIENVIEFALNYTELSGGFYDIVGFDPRGVGSTQPNINCFSSSEEEFEFLNGTFLQQGIEAKGNFTNQNETDPDVIAFLSQEPLTDLVYYALGQKCWEMNGDHLRYVGTTAVVRDIIGMANLFDGPEAPVNYWGFSYGTIIGSYLVNMFPHRVGHVIIDGVVNPQVWAAEPSYKLWSDSLQNTSDVFYGFSAACAMAGPTGCEIATNGSTAESIVQWTMDLMDAAYDFKEGGGTFGSADIRKLIFSSMYQPKNWPGLATKLYDYANEVWPSGNTTRRRRSLGSNRIPFPPLRSRWSLKVNYAFQAITCADALDWGNTTTTDVFNEVIYTAITETQMFAPMLIDAGFYCHKWVTRAPERYMGPWNATLKNPILVIGNKADPITPFTSAKFVADLLGDGAYLVEQDDFGHTSFAEHSDCTTAIIRNFLVDDTYPTRNQFCGTNQTLFPGQDVTQLILENGGTFDPKLNVKVPVPGTNIGLKNQELLMPPGRTRLDVVTPTDNGTTPSNNITTTFLQNEIRGLKRTRLELYFTIATMSIALLLSFALVFHGVFSSTFWKTNEGRVYTPVNLHGDD
ncbi:Alpha/Beta hydrolase protein [Cantharellus anzutake]|uniref:Alpha/Beta hydrolase protein n=1 Tax=Cantharellus anzutake TaxID=1750568 RepID=UPI001907C035|nr:Alpha/Beta hydrolase protein [Cantharellus anzutake]KAF8333063.1 Alpha/Beta hydrolase protein [Cantharellus anzutake]